MDGLPLLCDSEQLSALKSIVRQLSKRTPTELYRNGGSILLSSTECLALLVLAIPSQPSLPSQTEIVLDELRKKDADDTIRDRSATHFLEVISSNVDSLRELLSS